MQKSFTCSSLNHHSDRNSLFPSFPWTCHTPIPALTTHRHHSGPDRSPRVSGRRRQTAGRTATRSTSRRRRRSSASSSRCTASRDPTATASATTPAAGESDARGMTPLPHGYSWREVHVTFPLQGVVEVSFLLCRHFGEVSVGDCLSNRCGRQSAIQKAPVSQLSSQMFRCTEQSVLLGG